MPCLIVPRRQCSTGYLDRFCGGCRGFGYSQKISIPGVDLPAELGSSEIFSGMDGRDGRFRKSSEAGFAGFGDYHD